MSRQEKRTEPSRSFSSQSNRSFSNNSSPTVSRINSSGPLNINNFNKQSSPQDHLFYKCEALKRRLQNIEGMPPFLDLAFNKAEKLCEQQSLSLAQEKNTESMSRLSMSSFSSHGSGTLTTDTTNRTSGSQGSSGSSIADSLLTFTAGVLPLNISVDPATQLWQLFQQGAPLCLLFNTISSDHKLTVVSADDQRVCKKSVYEFIIAMKLNLQFEDDELFTISNVFSDSTQDLLKIISVVNKLLDGQKAPSMNDSLDDLNVEVKITDERSKVFREIIETERKYVQDLELMVTYRNQLAEAELLSSEQIHTLFPSLNEIVDFQRRFLNGLECNINVPVRYQRIGSVFIHASLGPFKTYEPWTIGQLTAIELINKEAANLKKSSTLIDPGFELQSYILKPIQRLCKYPLLLKELIKTSQEGFGSSDDLSDAAFASHNELLAAQEAMKEVANRVNEAQRRAENVEYLRKLVERVKNWRGFNLKDQGELLYHGIVGVRDADTEKEYVAYLFEKIIFFFVESDKDKEKHEKKFKLGLRKVSGAGLSSSTANLLESINSGTNDSSPLELKGRVYISEIYNISASSNHGYTLVISWSGKKESGSFKLRYRNEETRNQWEQCLRNLKTNEMNYHLSRKLRDSQSSVNTNDSSIYDYNGSNNTTAESPQNFYNDQRSSSGHPPQQRHYSSSSTYSMMQPSTRVKSGDLSRISSTGSNSNAHTTASTTPSSASAPHLPLPQFDIKVKLIYNRLELPDPLVVSNQIRFNELYQKISGEVATNDLIKEDILVSKLRYKDEDGDFVVMDSNEDWNLAIDDLGDGRSLTIWVS
ncbi:CDC24 [Candida margitis]|uniref:CDC24 n=1 Tax=Candida margitis TaxID=1775924 RepID=UPI002227BC4A|nr:CDC24 [Candida margitis]KAI5967980.1 CDC24 [Candida margitis]